MIRLSRTFCLLPLALGAFFASVSPVRAERPWVDVSPAIKLSIVAQTGPVGLTDLVFDHKGRLFARSDSMNAGALVLVSHGNPESYPLRMATGDAPVRRITALTGAGDGTFWAVDSADLLHINPDDRSGTISSRIPLASSLKPESRLTAIAVRGDRAYVADSGQPAIIIVDLRQGTSRRVLENNESLVAQRSIAVDNAVLRDPGGVPLGREDTLVTASPDGTWLFYQPMSGPLFRVETALLTDPNYSPIEQLEGVVQWRDTPSLGGMTMARDGTLYMTDIAHHAILRFTPGRVPQRLSTDIRLDVPRSCVVGPDGALYVATTTLDENATMQAKMPRWHGPGAIVRMIPPPVP